MQRNTKAKCTLYGVYLIYLYTTSLCKIMHIFDKRSIYILYTRDKTKTLSLIKALSHSSHITIIHIQGGQKSKPLQSIKIVLTCIKACQ